MRTCVWCDKPLPDSPYKGHRRREFCDKRCKQRHYMWHKQMKHDADMLADPYWRAAYALLIEQFKLLERRLREQVAELEEEHRRTDALEEMNQYYVKRYENLELDYTMRLKSLGMSEEDIKEFRNYSGTVCRRRSRGFLSSIGLSCLHRVLRKACPPHRHERPAISLARRFTK